MAYTIKDLATILGYSQDQVRVRLDRFHQALEGHIRKGRYNRIEVDNTGLAILQRAKQLEELHGDLRTVRTLLGKELPNGDGTHPPNHDGNGVKQPSDAWAKLVQTLEREVADLREENRWLRGMLEELQRRSLPPPKRRWTWWRWWR